MAKSLGTKNAEKKKTATKRGTPGKKSARKSAVKKSASKKAAPRKWSKKVNETSDALDLEQGVFKGNDPKKIARSLKRSAIRSKRKKTTPYQSAMSMLNFYINRGGKKLSTSKKMTLEKAKDVLRDLFNKDNE
jgi:hypothetical protein